MEANHPGHLSMRADAAHHTQLVTGFYSAFNQRDAAAMARCYHPQVEFNDPAFKALNFSDVTAMWTMLCERGKDLRIDCSDVRCDDKRGSARWVAHYTFSQTKRKVVNVIDAEFSFADGLIIAHTDRFDFHRWARQALGPIGFLLGWSGAFQRKVSATAMANLTTFKARK
jgi:hypothetical protein